MVNLSIFPLYGLSKAVLVGTFNKLLCCGDPLYIFWSLLAKKDFEV